jgi:spermidine synthase
VFFVATAAVAGALVMALQVVGARVIGAFYGVSLFVWTSLIGVTLLALALGYVLGGRHADRMRTPDMIYLWLGLAGLLTLAVPWLKGWVLPATAPLGPRWGTFASALVLFGPPFALLGAISPAIVRQLVSEPLRLGATVGALFGWSTLGSLAGTLLAGYVLLVHFGLAQILAACGALALAFSAAYFAWFRRAPWSLVALALPFVALALPGAQDAEALLEDGTRARVTEARSGFYGDVRVIEYRHGARATREMLIDGLVQGGIDIASGESVYETVHLLQELPLAHRPATGRCLVVGLGPGLVARWFAARGIATEAVEIDPVVIAAARRHFGFPETVPVALEDARRFLSSATGRYDCIVMDVFSGDTTPSHLLSREALLAARARLAPEGVLALNLIAGGDLASAQPVLATLERVFGHVRVYPLRGEPGPQAIANVLAVASPRPLAPLAAPQAWTAHVHPMARPGVERALGEAFAYGAAGAGPILTDDFNPIDVADAALKERLRRHILRTTAPQLLLASPRR